MSNSLRRTKRFLAKNAPTILSCVGAAGVIATSVLAVKATPKAIKLIEQAREDKGEELTKIEVVKVAGPVYIPAIITGLSTVACIFGANVLNKRQQASLMSAYAFLDSSYKEYKNKVAELYGEDANGAIKKEMARDKYDEYTDEYDIFPSKNRHLFFDSFAMRYFESTIENVQRAEYRLNRTLALKDAVSVNEFYDLLDIPRVENGDRYGWSVEDCFTFGGHSWIDFDHEKITLDDGLECYILTMPTEPVFNFDGY